MLHNYKDYSKKTMIISFWFLSVFIASFGAVAIIALQRAKKRLFFTERY